MLTARVMKRLILIEFVFLLYMLSQATWAEVEKTGSGLNTVVNVYDSYKVGESDNNSLYESEGISPPYFFVIIYSRDMQKDMAKLNTLGENLSEFYTSIGASKVRNFSKVVNYLSKSSDFTSTAKTLVRECAYEVYTNIGSYHFTASALPTLLTLRNCKDSVKAFEKVFRAQSHLLAQIENEVTNDNYDLLMTYNGHLIATMAIIESIKYLFQNKIPESALAPFELPNIFKEVFKNFHEFIQKRAEGLNTIVRIFRRYEDLQAVQKSASFVFPTQDSPYVLIIDFSQDMLKDTNKLQKLGETFTQFYKALSHTNFLSFFTSLLFKRGDVKDEEYKNSVKTLIQGCADDFLQELDTLLLSEEKPTATLELKFCEAIVLKYQESLLRFVSDAKLIQRSNNYGKTLESNGHIIATVSIIEAFKLKIQSQIPTISTEGLLSWSVVKDILHRGNLLVPKEEEETTNANANRKRKLIEDIPLPKRRFNG